MIFIDTGALIARYVSKDQYHEEALKIWRSLEGSSLLITNFILDEVLTYTGRITGSRFIAEKVRKIYASKSFIIVRPNSEDELEALRLFERFHDQNISYTDCVSFTLMNKNKVRKAFTFDRHFETAGFERIGPVERRGSL